MCMYMHMCMHMHMHMHMCMWHVACACCGHFAEGLVIDLDCLGLIAVRWVSL